jgi:hypothetical protein
VGTNPPNDTGLLDKYAEAFRKVFNNLDVVAKHKDDDMVAHYRGSIFMAA